MSNRLALEVKIVIIDYESAFLHKDDYTENSEFITKVIDRWSNIHNVCNWFSVSFNRYMYRESTDRGDVLYQAVEVSVYTGYKLNFIIAHDALNFIEAYLRLWKPHSYSYSIKGRESQ